MILFEGIEVSNEATVAELKQAVEDIFAHVPLKGAGKILWCVH